MLDVMSRRLGEILVDAKVLPEHSVAEALDRQRGVDKRFGAVLVEMGLVDEQTVVAALSEQFEMPVADLRHHRPNADAVARLPEKMARSLTAAPIRLTPGGLEVAVADPLDAATLARMEAAAGTPILLRLATVDDVRHAVDRSYPSSGRHRQRAFERTAPTGETGLSPTPHLPVDLSTWLVEAVTAEASDVYIERGHDNAWALMRVDGALLPVVMSRDSAVGLLQMTARADSRVRLTIDGRPVDVAIATIAGSGGERAHLRLSYRRRGEDRLNELGMPPGVLRSFGTHLETPAGLLLVAGPRRSGRSTTLEAVAVAMGKTGRSVIALDPSNEGDPCVFRVVPSAPGMREAVEAQDADVVVVDDLDDGDTAPWAARLALRGVTVVAAVRAPRAAPAITQLIVLGVDRFVLATALKAVLHQRFEPDRPGTHVPNFDLLELDDAARHGIRCGLFG